jgi:leucyl aminopeptidase
VGAAIAKAAVGSPAVVVDALGDLDGAERAAAADELTQGLVLGSYRFDAYKDAPEHVQLASASVVAKGGKKVAEAVERGEVVATAVCLARDLVNTPGGDLTPKAFAARAVEAGEAVGLEVEVWDLKAIRKAKMGGLLGVNRGSTELEPRFVILRHVPVGRPKGKVALVGKGITFDAGGLSIKPHPRWRP